MAVFNLYKLHFTSPLHISDRKNDYGTSLKVIQSDTMYAALTACLAKIGEKIPDGGNLGFTISSLFPYYQESGNTSPIYFLPMPLQTHMPELKDVSLAKKVKKVQWVDSKLYSIILQGYSLFEVFEDYINKIQSSYLTNEMLPTAGDGSCEFIKSEVFQRVRKEDRTGQEDSLPYYVDRLTFSNMSGLYFLVIGDSKLLDKALKLLALEGIGSERNVGFGFFEYEKDTIDIEIPTNAGYQVSLSLLIPETPEQLRQLLSADKVAYEFERRGGWITSYTESVLRKDAVYGFLPGAVFCNTCKEKIGKIVNLQPYKEDKALLPNPIWRNGISIMLPINLS